MSGIRMDPSDHIGSIFYQVQRILLILKNKGVLLAICSKNDENIALKALFEHPSSQFKKEELIKQFVTLFENEMMRKPTLNELYSNLISDSTQIDKEYLNSYWYKHNTSDSTILTIHGEDESKRETNNGLEMTTL